MTTTEQIRNTMKETGLYCNLYELQISELASALDERKKMQKIVAKEGRVIVKQGKNGEELVAHPLLSIINQFHRTIIQQMASLGLNRLKIDATPNKSGGLQAFLDEMNNEGQP